MAASASTSRRTAGGGIYGVDDSQDIVQELADQGTDLVKSTANYTLSAEVENLTLLGDTKINGTGNSLANKITGNLGDNTPDRFHSPLLSAAMIFPRACGNDFDRCMLARRT